MGKIVMTIVFAAALIRAADIYLFYGHYTDNVMFVTSQILQSFGL